MNNNGILILAIILIVIISTTIVLAYNQEIKQTSQEIFQKYFQEKINTLDENTQAEITKHVNQNPAEKFLVASKNQQKIFRQGESNE